VLALVIAVVILYPSQLFAQILIQRAWPLHLYQTSSRHYHVLAAPAEMALPSAMGPSGTAINAAGQVLVTNFSRTTLWSPPNVDTSSDHVVDFHTIFDIPRATGNVIASALNAYGQVAGVVQAPDSEAERSAVFLWTPRHALGSEGVITYLTEPALQQTQSYVWALNDYGQIIFEQDGEYLLWTPDAPNGAQGAAQPIRPDDSSGKIDLHALNAYGQVAGLADGRAFLWTPEQPHGTSGALTWLSDEIDEIDAINDFGQVTGHDDEEHVVLLWTPTPANAATGQLTHIPKPGGSDEIRFFALSPRGALAGLALKSAQNDALVWLPDAPNSPNGQLKTLGALGWSEDGLADQINASGTVVGYSCSIKRGWSDAPCEQVRYFVWDQMQGMQDLQSLLDQGSGYALESVWGLNDQGQIVAVGETSAGTYRLLLLTLH
jgi:hypothetical protein